MSEEKCGSCAFHRHQTAWACHMKVREPICFVDGTSVVRESYEDACEKFKSWQKEPTDVPK